MVLDDEARHQPGAAKHRKGIQVLKKKADAATVQLHLTRLTHTYGTGGIRQASRVVGGGEARFALRVAPLFPI